MGKTTKGLSTGHEGKKLETTPTLANSGHFDFFQLKIYSGK